MAKIGYARVSSKEQHLARQLQALNGVDKLFTDKLSGANTQRPALQKLLAYIREGDIEGWIKDTSIIETQRMLEEAHQACPYSRAIRGIFQLLLRRLNKFKSSACIHL